MSEKTEITAAAEKMLALEIAARNYHKNSIPDAEHMAEWHALKEVLEKESAK